MLYYKLYSLSTFQQQIAKYRDLNIEIYITGLTIHKKIYPLKNIMAKQKS